MDLRKKQRAVVDALEDIKGRDIQIFDTARFSTLFERVVIASGDSTRQVKALADNVCEKLTQLGARVYGVEGGGDADWILVDLGDVVVHVMHPAARSYYQLEEIWGGKPVRLRAPAATEGRLRRVPARARKRAARAKP